MTASRIDPASLIPDDEVFLRMTLTERWQHGLLIVSFVLLILSGLPVLSEDLEAIRLIAGRAATVTVRGLVHRAAAIVLIADLVWHLAYTLFTRRGRQNWRDRTPRRQDLRDALAVFHPRSPRPEFDRYSFAQKFEYWALIWGSAVMIVTGALMWAPDLSLALFPLWLHQALVVIHGYEAVLAFVAILIWHMYTAHLDPGIFPMSWVWLNGRMTGAELKRFHPLEYRRILAGRERLARELLALDEGAEGGGPVS